MPEGTAWNVPGGRKKKVLTKDCVGEGLKRRRMTDKKTTAETAAVKAAVSGGERTDLPYERFFRFGAENLTEAELLAIIIRVGTKGQNALDVAKQVLGLARYPKEGLLGLYDVTLDELKGVGGIGEVKAVQLKCLTELSKRISTARAREGINFTSPDQAAEYFMEKLRHRTTECVMLVCLDTKGQMLCEKKISEGSVNMSLISPREIFLTALEMRAVNILLVHNHPSGDPTPSSSDKILTCHVREAGEGIGIPLLDHIVIGDRRHVSFRAAGWFLE